MKSAWSWSVAAFVAAAVSVSVWAQGTEYSKIEFTPKKVSSNLYMLSGSPNVDMNHPDAAGGLVGVLTGPDGVFMVDAQYGQVSEKLLAAIKAISPAPIRFMANTHIHPDHTVVIHSSVRWASSYSPAKNCANKWFGRPAAATVTPGRPEIRPDIPS